MSMADTRVSDWRNGNLCGPSDWNKPSSRCIVKSMPQLVMRAWRPHIGVFSRNNYDYRQWPFNWLKLLGVWQPGTIHCRRQQECWNRQALKGLISAPGNGRGLFNLCPTNYHVRVCVSPARRQLYRWEERKGVADFRSKHVHSCFFPFLFSLLLHLFLSPTNDSVLLVLLVQVQFTSHLVTLHFFFFFFFVIY